MCIHSEKTSNIMLSYLKQNKYVDVFCVYSFGIYVFHEWMSWGLYHHSTFFSVFEKYPIIYAFLFTIFDFIVSIILTHYSLKTKMGKYLLL